MVIGIRDGIAARYAHHDSIYDFTIDTTNHNPEQCAGNIKRALANDAQPHAFDEMRRRFLQRGR